MKKSKEHLTALSLFAFLSGALLVSPLPAQAGPEVTVVNPPSQPVPVTGSVGIVGTPTVNIGTGSVSVGGPVDVNVLSKPGITVGGFFFDCTFNFRDCMSNTIQSAPPGKAFRIDSVQGETLNTGTVPVLLEVGIGTPGLSGSFFVPCVAPVFLANRSVCSASPGMHATQVGGVNFVANLDFSSGGPGEFGRVFIFYTVVDLAP